MRIPLAVLAGILTFSTPLLGEQAPLSRLPSTNGLFATQPKPGQKLTQPVLPFLAAVQPRLAPTIVCGMTMVPADPKIDVDIRRTAPANPKAVIRVVEPSVCQAKQAR